MRKLFLSCCFVLVIVTNGCVTARRETFLNAHSLDAFIVDRPQAGKLLHQHPALEQWLRTEWNRPIQDYRLCWNNNQERLMAADHSIWDPYRLIVIRVSQELAPADQLLGLSYEVCNAQGRKGFNELMTQAASGNMTREAFVTEIQRREFAALLRIKQHFPNLLPLSTNEIAQTRLYRMLLEIPENFQEYQAWSIRTHSANYLAAEKLYTKQYDALVGKKSGGSEPQK